MIKLARFRPFLVATLVLLFGCSSVATPDSSGASTPAAASGASSTPSRPPSEAPQRTSAPTPSASASSRPSSTQSVPTASGSQTPDANTRYTQEEIDYLKDIALGSEFGNSSNTVKKWPGDVDIAVNGKPTTEDSAVVDEVVEDLNGSMTSGSTKVVDRDPDITIFFVPSSDFSDYIPEYVPGNNGFFYYRYREGGELYKADIVIRSEGIDQELRSHLIREELTQSLGLAKDSDKYPDSIFFGGSSLTQTYSDLDEIVIAMLYGGAVEAGFTEKDIDKTFEPN